MLLLSNIRRQIVLYNQSFATIIVANQSFNYKQLIVNNRFFFYYKYDINKLLATTFIQPLEEAMWLSLIIIVQKKN